MEQEADWPMLDGAPMLFLGQVDIPHSAGLFHAAAAAFVFLCPTLGEARTIIQVA